MGNGFKETSVNKIDDKKFDENFKGIDWSAILNKKVDQWNCAGSNFQHEFTESTGRKCVNCNEIIPEPNED